MRSCNGGGGTFLFCIKRETENRSGLLIGCGEDRGSLIEKGFGIRSVSRLTIIFQAPFQFASQTRTAVLNGLPLGYVLPEVTAVFLRKNERGGNAAAAATPHHRLRRSFPSRGSL